MLGLVGAVLLAIAVYAQVTRDLLPPRAASPARRRRPEKPRPWSVTLRACEVMGWSTTRLRVWSWGSALAAGIGWAVLLQDPLAGLPVGWIGYQVPGFLLELRASHTLGVLQRQLGVFIGTVHDHLHARGATVEDALWAASLAISEGPLAPAMAQYRRQVETHVSLHDRLTALERRINWPTVAFFFSLLRLRDETGTAAMAHAFESLTEKLQDDERIQQTVRGELSMYLTVLLVSWAATIAIFPYDRLTSATWPAFHHHLGVLVTLAAFGSAVVFHGVRKFARMEVAVAD